MAEAIVAIVILTKRLIWDPLRKTIVTSKDMQVLEDATDTLVSKWCKHEDLVQTHKRTMIRSDTYTNWYNKVNLVVQEAVNLQFMYTKEKEKEKERKRSFLFSIKSRSSFAKKMRKTACRVFALIAEDDTHLPDHLILVEKKPECVQEILTPSIRNFPTLHHALQQTLGWLSDKKVRGIRIHGHVGSGKTTILKNLNNHVKVAQMFDIVICVTVSKFTGINQIQYEIAQRLNISFNVTTDHLDLIAFRIREKLKDIKYLLLLDDVMEDLDLDKIGVPISTSENDSKIVFTTRLQLVFSSIATRQISVPRLNRDEALEMFTSILLTSPYLDLILKFDPSIINELVNWCGDHPLVINVVANVFRMMENIQIWDDGLAIMKRRPEQLDPTMQEIFKLKCCFDCLKVTQKKCFFYSALNPKDSDDDHDVEETRGNVDGGDVFDYLKKRALREENKSQ